MDLLKKIFHGSKIGLLGLVFASLLFLPSTPVFAAPEDGSSAETAETTEATESDSTETIEGATSGSSDSASCNNSLGAIGWLVCPTTGKIAEAVDWLYGVIEDILVINPLSMEDGSPIYELWKIILNFTNIVFVIFILVVVISQITGYGINNYGIKRSLPKLIVAAILVNLSFLLCELGIELSNIIGSSLRSIFTSIEEASLDSASVTGAGNVSYTSLYGAIASGAALTIAGTTIAFETGVIWMLIPTVFAALIAVATGLITVALRQAVVTLLVIISPLAIVSNILPNTEKWFQKWYHLLFQMLIFYPMFSLLFGVSSLAGWALIISADSGVGVLLGIAVQVFPLFFSWKLMQMSDTFLGRINTGLRSLAARPLARNQRWAMSHRDQTHAATLARPNPYTPSAHLMQYLNDRATYRKLDTDDNMKHMLARGGDYYTRSFYKNRDVLTGTPNRRYEDFSRKGADDLLYQTNAALRSTHLEGGPLTDNLSASEKSRFDRLGETEVARADALFAANSKLSYIQYKNARGRQERFQSALFANNDRLAGPQNVSQWHKNQYNLGGLDRNGQKTTARLQAESRYDMVKEIMGGDQEFEYAAADAAVNFGSQAGQIQKKITAYASLIPGSVDLEQQVRTLANAKNSNEHIDAIIGGLKTINQRGDTDVVKRVLDDTLVDPTTHESKVELGTYASQSLASFLMFDVKNSDPLLRRFGKYINIETARTFNPDPEKRRYNKALTFDEYITGEYDEVDENGEPVFITDDSGNQVRKKGHSKRDAASLLHGTSFKEVERTAFGDITEAVRKVSKNEDGSFNYEKFKEYQAKIWESIAPNLTGDQFSFLSGSEQIKSLASFVTGMSGDDVDWNGIFGADIAASLTPEQKADYFNNFLVPRTKNFLNGQVPNQILRTKSDMFGPEIAVFEKQVRDEHPDYDDDAVKEETKKRLQAALNPTTYDSASISYSKGIQNDTKPKVAEYYDFDGHFAELVRQGKIKPNGQRIRSAGAANPPAGGSLPTGSASSAPVSASASTTGSAPASTPGSTADSASNPSAAPAGSGAAPAPSPIDDSDDDDDNDSYIDIDDESFYPIDPAVEAAHATRLAQLDQMYQTNVYHDSNDPVHIRDFYSEVLNSTIVPNARRADFESEVGSVLYSYASVSDLYDAIHAFLAR